MNKKEQLYSEYLRLTKQFHGERLYTLSRFWELFAKDTNKLRKKTGPLHCTNINRILTEDLLASGLFEPRDITSHWTLLWYCSPHQYLKIKTEVGWTSVDIWAKNFGIEFGDYAHGFHLSSSADSRAHQ